MINLENFDEHGRSKPLINSPRSLEACKRQGIEPTELIIKQIHEMKNIYKDGMNDKKSLEIKLEHYEFRRKQKLELVRNERNDLIENPSYERVSNYNNQRTVYKEVENKLEKKKIMDEVKEEIKRKQVQIKDLDAENRIKAIEQRKNEQKAFNQKKEKEKETRKNMNLIHHEMDKLSKINNWMESKEEKLWKIEEAERQKQLNIEMKRKEKDEYYQSKSQYAQDIKKYYQQDKEHRYKQKEQYLDELKQIKETNEAEHRKQVGEAFRKDAEWKESKRKEMEIEEKKRQQEIMGNITTKEFIKNETLNEVRKAKEARLEETKADKEKKKQLIKEKEESDKYELEKRRKIMEYKEKLQLERDQELEKEKQIERQMFMEGLKEKEKLREENKMELEEERKLKAWRIEQAAKEKELEVEQQKRNMEEIEKEKLRIKNLRLQEVAENQNRREIINQYDNEQKAKKYNDKIQKIEHKQKTKVESRVIPVSRKEIEEKIYSNEKPKHKTMERESVSNPYAVPSKDLNQTKDRGEEKEKLKKEEIRKLIENLKIECNKKEFQMMKEEEAEEKKRQDLETTSDNVAELKRLQKIHGVERARFQESLNQFIRENQEKVERFKKNFEAEL